MQKPASIGNTHNEAPYETLVQSDPNTVVFAQSHRVVSKFQRRQAVGIGTTLIVLGVMGMIFNGVDIGISTTTGSFSMGEIGHGFWIGAVVVVAGSFGIAAGIHKKRGLIHTFNVLCIVAASLTAFQFIFGVMSSVFSKKHCSYMIYYRETNCNQVPMIMEAMLAVLAVVEAIMAICGSVMCCKVACCCNDCCSNDAPLTQSMIVNDVPMTVIYQPQTGAIMVVSGVPVQGSPPVATHISQSSDINDSRTMPLSAHAAGTQSGKFTDRTYT